MEECKKCPAFAKCIWNHGGAMCKALRKSYGLDETQKPLTNADRIRSMSDEELAEFINDGTVCDRCSFLGACVNPYSPERCKEGVLAWLRQPVTQPHPGADDNHDHSGLLEE